MQAIGGTVLATAISVAITLVVTLIFNKLIGLPRAIRQQREAERLEREATTEYQNQLEQRLSRVEEAVNALPGYRQQSLQIQSELRNADSSILDVCSAIQDSLRRLERRERNALCAKLLAEYRLFTDPNRNPRHAWTEMEHHAFFELLRDYENLGGNDYVHSTVLPAMNELDVILMSDSVALANLMASRQM